MNIRKIIHSLLPLPTIIALTVFPIVCQASTSKLLQLLNEKITSVKMDLTEQQTQKTQFENELQSIEQKTATLSKKLNGTRTDVEDQQKKLHALEHLQRTDEETLTAKKKLIIEQLQNAYLFSRQPYMKVLLSQQSTNSFNRMLTYYHYFYKNQTESVETLQNTLQQIQMNQVQIKEQLATLTLLNQQQQNEKQQLDTMKSSRNELLHTVKGKIRNEHDKLTQLIQDKHQLEETVYHLFQSEKNQSFPTNADFSKLIGRLPWPTHGTITDYFGEPIDKSELRWNGVVIKAAEGQAIYSIASGTVVFAKWLAGYGLLLIVNHGNGYMSLYGRNQTLYKKAGDTVHAGELIGAVGETGGFQTPSLYFAIRHDAKPLNPADWCKGPA